MERTSRSHSGTTPAYRHVVMLAEGGMGTVEVALRRDGTFRRLYAVKRLRESLKDDEDVRTMFLDEARLAGLIDTPTSSACSTWATTRTGPSSSWS